MYVSPNFLTKKALKSAIANNQPVEVFSPGPLPCPSSGQLTIEGPHYPQPHKWYARVEVLDSLVIHLIS